MKTDHATHNARASAGEFISTYEAALIVGRAPDTVRSWVRRGRLNPAITTRAGHLYSLKDVQQLAAVLRRESEATARRFSAPGCEAVETCDLEGHDG